MGVPEEWIFKLVVAQNDSSNLFTCNYFSKLYYINIRCVCFKRIEYSGITQQFTTDLFGFSNFEFSHHSA